MKNKTQYFYLLFDCSEYFKTKGWIWLGFTRARRHPRLILVRKYCNSDHWRIAGGKIWREMGFCLWSSPGCCGFTLYSSGCQGWNGLAHFRQSHSGNGTGQIKHYSCTTFKMIELFLLLKTKQNKKKKYWIWFIWHF